MIFISLGTVTTKRKSTSKRSVLLGYFIDQSTSCGSSIVLSSLSEKIEKVTNGEISKIIHSWRNLSRSDNQIMIFSNIQGTNHLHFVDPNVEEMCLVDLGPINASEEDGINIKFENIRKNLRRSCSALCQQLSIEAIEIDPCDYPKIAAESAVYGIFYRNEIECNIPRNSYFYDASSAVLPISIKLLCPENCREYSKETFANFEEGLIVGECQNFARFLHGSGFYISREEFIKSAKDKLSGLNNVSFINREESWIQNTGMKSILQVASMNKKYSEQGKLYSSFQQAPCVLEIHYNSYASSSHPIMLVGRSSFYHSCESFFMTGKRQPVHLIQNLSGGASIISTILALARMQMPVHVIGIIVICDTSFSWRNTSNIKFESEYDIFSEVPDSHEERLILKDAVSYACTFKPELVITVATQTNYLTEAFKTNTSVIFSSDDFIADLFLKACSDTGERFIRLPFVDIEDNLFDKCIIEKQFCSDCRDVLNKPLTPETRKDLTEYISKNYDFCFITSCCLKDYLEGRRWLHLELNKNLLFHRNNQDEIYVQHEITGSPTRSFIYFIQSLVVTMDEAL